MEEAFREEEREQERLHAVTGPGICKRATSAGQQRRTMYTKHKISNPLSCPGKSIANACEVNVRMRYHNEGFEEDNEKVVFLGLWSKC